MVGPLKGGSHKKKYLLVMVDKFTKWIEAKPVRMAEAGPVIYFIFGVVHRYGVLLMRTSIPLLHPQPLLLYILDRLLELAHAN